MKLTTVTHVSLDGVMQGLGGAEEDRRGGFSRGGWALPLFTDDGARYVSELFQRADAFLLGRWTYELFARYWGPISDPSNPIAAALNGRPKYVVSNTLTTATWARTTVLSGDVGRAIRDLKAGHDGEVQVHGSGQLIRSLLDYRLIDELVLITYPLVLGQGRRLFPEDGPDLALQLVESRSTPTDITIQTYRPIGRPQYAE